MATPIHPEAALRVVTSLEAVEHHAAGGATNSRPTDKSGRAGVDTLRLRHRLDGDAYDALGRHGYREGPRGERWFQEGGIRVGAYPDGLLYTEARTAVRLQGPEGHGLVSAAGLSEVAWAEDEFLGALGLDGDHDPAVGRIDLATDLPFEDGRDGQALIQAAAHVDLPWLKAGTEGSRRDGLESVTWRNVRGRSVQARLYDKGVESGLASPGKWLRLERQIRFRREREQRLSALASADLGKLYAARYLGGFLTCPEIAVCDRRSAVERLRELEGRGDVSPAAARRLAGLVVMGDEGMPARTARRWWAELRRLGIALDVHEGRGVVVALADYTRSALNAWDRAA
jgi:hypothetical protein